MFNKRGYEVVTSSESTQKDSRTKVYAQKTNTMFRINKRNTDNKETTTMSLTGALTLNVFYIIFKCFYS